ncbi:MAG: winged helix-turn-helix transcriptional regulator [Candidatus Dadabacteria bacterium]|nr:winged helix-turn-helix transcriptional regulator [Candidatus Dadabacteria bacterium]NIS09792.1 winged helix-turn-helix transcriptional regulator [Candidatus Dadabacteria bacterium]NIV41148.1 MarR family transcriptional regulator [Candidatus Dadabacteria bacterium]NIX16233.1 MarR family transcriptional regulator [Candidatus Dadabacteria bacterium]NIY22853.1 MarR family transcriptional regulator [Candidatus Dadabacteria bacterium]
MKKENKQFNLSNVRECTACAGFNTRKLNRVITQIFDDAFKDIDFRSTQFTPLVMIFANGPITVNKLSENLVMDRTTLGRNLKPLERDGLIKIEPGIDKRQKLISITDKGIKLLNRAYPIWQKTQKKILNQIGETNWQGMLKEINTLLPKLQKVE